MARSDKGHGRTVAVTGATGYIGSHVVRTLLEHGHHVRAVVRDPGNTENVAHLASLAPQGTPPPELVPGDLLQPGSYDDALAGCDWVCHVASSVRLSAKDPQRVIVDPAVEGTRNVLTSARKAGSVKRVVVTSSIAAVAGDNQPEHHVFTEADWNDTATLERDPYFLAKTLAERAAWDFVRTLPDGSRFDLITLNPVMVMGPLYKKAHNRSSPNILRDIFTGRMPACPRFYHNLVDVRDVALAHVRALELPDAEGRYILHAEGLWMQEMGRLVKPRFPSFKKIRTRALPDIALYAAALFDRRMSIGWVRKNLGKVIRVDNSRSRQGLSIEYRPVEETLADTCQSFIDLGLARP